jgi:hypothetical protein
MARPSDLTQDRVAVVTLHLAARFAGRPALKQAILSVLNELSDNWSDHPQGIEGDGFDRLNAALVSPIEALLTLSPDRAEYTVDQLVTAWEKVRGDLVWVA